MNFFDKFLGVDRGRQRHPVGTRAKRIDPVRSKTASALNDVGNLQEATDKDISDMMYNTTGSCGDDHSLVPLFGTSHACACSREGCKYTYDPANELQ